jgi:hypothetical protein
MGTRSAKAPHTESFGPAAFGGSADAPTMRRVSIGGFSGRTTTIQAVCREFDSRRPLQFFQIDQGT